MLNDWIKFKKVIVFFLDSYVCNWWKKLQVEYASLETSGFFFVTFRPTKQLPQMKTKREEEEGKKRKKVKYAGASSKELKLGKSQNRIVGDYSNAKRLREYSEIHIQFLYWKFIFCWKLLSFPIRFYLSSFNIDSSLEY